MKHRKHRWLAGTLAFLLSCSALIPSGNAVFAASKGRIAESETNVTKEEKGDEGEEQITAETLTIEQGETFEIEKDFTGLSLKKGEKAVLKDVVSEDGQGFFADRPGTYLSTYLITPEKGDSYEVTRKIVVKPREAESKGADHGQKGNKEDTEESDPEPEPVLTEAPEVPENTEHLKLDVSPDNAAFLSVVPESMAKNRSINANLVVGERLPYPSSLGNYSTTYFTVNGHVAYCLESAKTSPPSSDYVANIFESNLALQKVLYYGYGGPGDITDSYMPGFDWKLKYIFTHIAASYAYCGTDGFYGCTFENIQSSGLWDYIQYLNGLEAPPKAAIDLSPTSAAAYESNGEQRTKEFHLKGDHRNYITLNLPENVTYHSGDTTKTGSVKISGGTKFYFSAPMTVTGTWNSGSLAGQMGTQWKTLVVSTGGTTQDIGYGTFFEEESDSVSFQVKWMDYAKVKVVKKDNVTNTALAGAVFGIYSDKECTKLITKMPATNEKGETQVDIPKTQDTVYLKEISVPQGYKLNTSSFNVKLEAGKTQSQTVTNEEQKGKITIRKSGEVLSSVSGKEGHLTFQYQSAPFGEASYFIYAAENIVSQDQKTPIYQSGELVDKLTTKADGSITSKELHLGKYKIVEQKAPADLTIGKTEADRTQFVTLSYAGQTVELVQEEAAYVNARPGVKVQAVKQSENDKVTLEGAVFGLYAAEDIRHPNGKSEDVHKKDELVAQDTIQDGKADFTNLYLGNYYVKEISPGEGYLLDETAYPVEVGYEGQEVAIVHRNVTVKETVKKQAFELIKISEDGNQTETELLEGAGFKVFLIQDLKGVKDGSLKPSEGNAFRAEDFIGYDYSEDETAHYYENGKKVSVEELFTDKKGFVRSPELPYGKYVVFESTTPENLQTINPFLVTISEDSREPQPWRVFDDRPIQFFLKIIKEDAQTHLPVLNNHAQYKIYDVKKKEYVTMKVRYPEEKELDVFETNDEGYLMTPEQLKMGTYRIEEVKAPDLYVQPGYEMALKDGESDIPLNQLSQTGAYEDAKRDFITITVNSETAYEVEEETGKYIVVVRQQNDEAVGSLTIKKTGEDIVGAKNVEDSLLTKMKNGIAGTINSIIEFFGKEEVIEEDSGYMFQYENKGAEGVTFEVYAKETIYTPDGQKDEAGNRKVLYEKDGLVAELVTGEDGSVSLHNLPIGSYYLKETDVGNHHFVLDPEAKEFEIKYQGQEVAVDYVSMELENKRQKIELVLTKQSKETKEPVQGAVFGLYAEEDILDLTGEVIVKAGEFLAKAESAEDGTLRFDIDLPHGKYMVKELEAAPGYLKTEETWSFDATYQNPELEVISLAKEIENQPTVVEITKTDITDEKEVEGAKLQILNKDGEIVEEWVSTKEPHKVYALEPGEYILHEEAAPEGYLVVSDVPFVVEETGEIQKVEMKDERPSGQLLIQKADAENKAPLAGVEFELRNKATGEVVGTLVTGEDGTAKSEELPIAVYEEGKYVEPIVYVLVETKPLEGYEANTEEVEVVFEYQDDETKIIEVTEEVENTRKPGTPPLDAPKTGDDTRAWIPVVIMSAALLGAFFIVIRIRRRKR